MHGLDWMFVTAEVPEDRIKEAFEGIRALNFSGAAFLPPHRTAGSSLVDSMTESAIRSGQVRIARRDGNSWLGEDTLGAAIVELLRFENMIVDDGSCIASSGREWLPHVIRLAAPDSWKPRLVECVKHREAASATDANDDQGLATNQSAALMEIEHLSTRPQIPSIPFDEMVDDSHPISVFIVDASSTPPAARILKGLSWSDHPALLLVEPHAQWESALASLQIPNLRVFRPLDIAAAKAVVNFLFWTGIATDLVNMRDALDEYCQW